MNPSLTEAFKAGNWKQKGIFWSMVKCLGGNDVFFIQNRFWKSVLFSERLINISGFVNGQIILAQTCLLISIFVCEFDYIIKPIADKNFIVI